MIRLALAAIVAAFFVTAASAQELTLKRVMLSSGGVGYFEYEASVDGNAELKLTVRLDDVDDVLKSLVIYDDKGGIGSVSLPGRAPLSQAFSDLPFGQSALGSPAALLGALQGAEISVGGPRQLSGRVISVTQETARSTDGKETFVRHRVSLMTSQGIEQFILEDAENLQFSDPTLKRQVADALAAVRANRDRDSRTLTISMRGTGKRLVRAAYIVGVPLWKASYRVTLPADTAAGKAAVQGWAVLENMTGRDWKDVELTLVSGRPVTFRQALYQAYYVNRPEVPVEVLGRVLPNPDRGGMPAQAASPPPPARGAYNKSQSAPAPLGMVLREAAVSDTVATSSNEVDAGEAATQVSFKFAQPVSVAAGRTITIPILDRDLPIKQVSIYQPDVVLHNPLAAIDVRNDGDSGLPPGVITIYQRGAKPGETTYVGDARLSGLPAGESRLLSYAVDNKVTVERELKSVQRFSKGSFVRGLFQYTVTEQQETTYHIKGAAKEARELIIEQPALEGWKLTKPDLTTVERSDGRYRMRVKLAPGALLLFDAVMERPIVQILNLSAENSDQIRMFLRNYNPDKATYEALTRIVALQNNVADAQRHITDLDRTRAGVVQDQARVRDNLQRVPANSDLQRRYLAKLDEQETALESMDKDRKTAEQAVAKARQALADYIRQL